LKKIVTVILIALCFVFVVACAPKRNAEEVFSTTAFFGTYIEIALVGEDNSKEQQNILSQAKNEMLDTLQAIHNALDADGQEGDMARFNALCGGEKTTVSKYTAECFDLARRIYDVTAGAYNPAVYALVDLWGFSSRVLSGENSISFDYDRTTPSVPDQKYITAFMQLTDFESVIKTQGDNGEYYLTKPQDCVSVDGKEYFLRMDFGGICKGYAGDVLREIASKYGITKGYLSIGQSSITFFDSVDSNGYDLDMENPLNPSQTLFTKKNIKNQSISVSGDYQRFFEEDGKRYCHIIDVNTGYPVDSDIKAVFAQCDSSAVCDAITTALMTMTVEEIAKLSQSQAFDDLGVKSVTIVRCDAKEGLQVLSNAKDLVVSDEVDRYTYSLTEKGVVFKKTAKKYLPVVFVFVMVVVVVIIAFAEKNKKAREGNNGNKENFVNIRFFQKGDLILYGVLAVVVIALFLGVGLGKKRTMTAIEVYYGEHLLAVYDTSKHSLTTSLEWQDELQVTQENGKIILKVYTADKTQFNQIEFFDGQAVMTQADCFGKDCTKTFNCVAKANQTVVCLPHDLRIVGVGEGNKEVR